MKQPNIGQIVAQVWADELKESPNPFVSGWLYDEMMGRHRTYRDYLDLQPLNYYGEPIPRIVTVRRNLRQFKAVTKWDFTKDTL